MNFYFHGHISEWSVYIGGKLALVITNCFAFDIFSMQYVAQSSRYLIASFLKLKDFKIQFDKP